MAKKPSYEPEAKRPATGEDAVLSKDGKGGKKKAKPWLDRIDQALDREKTWRTRGSDVIKRFRDERGKRSSDTLISKINILWSNTEVLKSALYARTAVPDVRRRYPDAAGGDPLARTAAECIERALGYCNDTYDVDQPIEDAISDYLLPGRGTVWITYEPEIIGEGEEAHVGEQKLYEEFCYWKDFCHGKARTWKKVPWVARRHALSLGEFKKKFPNVEEEPNLTYSLLKNDESKDSTAGDNGEDGLVECWEVWDKGSQDRIYVARGFAEEVQRESDPYGLRDFFPCPKPLFSVMTTDQLIPEPEFCLYQDQADELDRVAGRIKVLLEALKWKGIFDGSIDGDNVLATLSKAGDNVFLAYPNWNVLKEKGGIENAVGFWPLEKIILVLEQLYPRAAQLIQEIYEITGISDIIRGATDPNETLGAQKLKSQFGSMRMQKRQRNVQGFIRDGYRIKAEIIAEHFTQDTLKAITNLDLPTREEQLAAQAEIDRLTMEAEAPMPGMGHNGGPPLEMPPLPPGGMAPPPMAPEAMAAPPPVMEAPLPAPGMSGAMLPGMQEAMLPPAPPGMNGGVPPELMNGGGGEMPPPAGLVPQAPQPGMPPPPPEAMPPEEEAAPAAPEIPPELQHAATSPTWEDLIDLLRNDKLRGTRIDVETDSTIFVDAEAEKQGRIEFMGAARELLTGAMEMITVAPSTIPLVKEMFLFGVRSFKPGRALEEAFEDAFDALAADPPQPPEEPVTGPDPAIEQAKIDVQIQEIEKKYGLEENKALADATAKQDSIGLDAEIKRAEVEIEKARVELEREKVELDREKNELEREKIALESKRLDQEGLLRERELDDNAAFKSREIDEQSYERDQQADLKSREMDQQAGLKSREMDQDAELQNRSMDQEAAFKSREMDDNYDLKSQDISAKAAAKPNGNGKPALSQRAASRATQVVSRHQAEMKSLQDGLSVLAEAMAKSQQMTAQIMAKGFASQGQQMAELVEKVAAPKRVVRGPDNRIVGVETVQ